MFLCAFYFSRYKKLCSYSANYGPWVKMQVHFPYESHVCLQLGEVAGVDVTTPPKLLIHGLRRVEGLCREARRASQEELCSLI